MTQRLRKVVFPVAGLGTRFLPASKVVAKEMLPVLDKPLIQYAVDEAVDAGADTLIFVTNRYKHAIADYFDTAYELERKLEGSGKKELLALVQNVIPKHVRCVFVTQSEALGLGHAVLCAKPVVGDEPFGVILPDDLIWNRGKGALRQMAEFALAENAGAIAVEEVPRSETNKYGIVDASPTSDRSHGTCRAACAGSRRTTSERTSSHIGEIANLVRTRSSTENTNRTTRAAYGRATITSSVLPSGSAKYTEWWSEWRSRR